MKELFLSFVALAVAPAGLAYANPRALPFTYTTDTLAPGAAEIEQTVDAVPLRATSINTGAETSYLATSFQTELEIGLCRNLELALYFTFAPAQQSLTNTARLPESNGIKQRLRYILADPGEWPIDVGFYGELSRTIARSSSRPRCCSRGGSASCASRRTSGPSTSSISRRTR